MKLTYHQFLKFEIDLAPLGVMKNRQSRAYFCTPKGARIFGAAGVDGIHFCFVRGFGETVFIVSPMNGAEDCVHPVARSFQDFLRLLLACHDALTLEQVWQWSAAELDDFERQHAPTKAQEAVLVRLEKELGLRPMAEPWKYIHTVQTGFDDTKLRFRDEFYDAAPQVFREEAQWKVFFEGGFSGGHGRAGKEISIQKTFDWDKTQVYVPSVYSCARGLVVDLAVKVPAEDIRAFCEKWALSPQNDGSSFTQAQREVCERENPLALNVHAQASVNGSLLSKSHGCSFGWNPLFEDCMDEEARAVMEHYGLDAGEGWVVCRMNFPWQTEKKPKLSRLELILRQKPCWEPGPEFQASAGEVPFSCLGQDYTLRVLNEEAETIPESETEDFGALFMSVLQYDITPPLPAGAARVKDTAPAFSRPVRMHAPGAGEIGIIGGADGPTAVFLKSGEEKKAALGSGSACSALRQERKKTVTWKIMLKKNDKAPLHAKLL